MALLDFAVYFDFKFYAAVRALAFNINAFAYCVFVRHYRGRVTEERTQDFMFFRFCGFRIKLLSKKTLETRPFLWYTEIIKHAKGICLL